MPHFFWLRDSDLHFFSLMSESLSDFFYFIDYLRLKVKLLLQERVEVDQGLIGIDQFVSEALHEPCLVLH